jgi:glyceraldehyde 3-phosphate dehydrogenase
VVGRNTTVEEVNAAMKKASETAPLKGVFSYTEEELVSSDFKGDPASSTLDSKLTRVIGGNLVKTFAWYDNEWGYSNRVKDLITFLGEKGL